jgi:hypothetical protein
MERDFQDKGLALVLGGPRTEAARQTLSLRESAWDALALFGEEMPAVAYIGTVAFTPRVELLIDDLRRYGVPIRYFGQNRMTGADHPAFTAKRTAAKWTTHAGTHRPHA